MALLTTFKTWGLWSNSPPKRATCSAISNSSSRTLLEREGERLMPWAPKRACRYQGCPALTVSGYCEQHSSERGRYNRERTTNQSIYDWRWRQYSKRRLQQFPLCEECHRNGRVATAAVTDHVIPHRGDLTLFWDPTNHESKCIECHNRKSATEVIHRG
jgi:5-methylcytosine-specific restriction enzyme A